MTFDEFWEQYDKKVGRKKCLAKWSRLTEDDINVIAWTLTNYIQATPDKQFRKHPITYLNGECWHDEIIKPKTNEQFSEESKRARMGRFFEGFGGTMQGAGEA